MTLLAWKKDHVVPVLMRPVAMVKPILNPVRVGITKPSPAKPLLLNQEVIWTQKKIWQRYMPQSVLKNLRVVGKLAAKL